MTSTPAPDQQDAPEPPREEECAPNDQAPNDQSLELWRTLRGYIVTLWQEFGPPEEMRDWGPMGPRLRAEIIAFLAPIEALLRRLIARDAVLLAKTLTPLTPRAPRSKVSRQRPSTSENANAWRPHFSFRESGDQAHARQSHQTTPTYRVYAAARIAARFEACMRAFNDPAPYVKRLAHRLQRKAKTARLLACIPRAFNDFLNWRLGRDPIAQSVGLLRSALIDTS